MPRPACVLRRSSSPTGQSTKMSPSRIDCATSSTTSPTATPPPAPRSPPTPPDIVNRLAADEKVSVRQAAAGNPSTPEDALRRLARSEDPKSLVNLAGNEGAPFDVQEGALRRVEPLRGDGYLFSEAEMDQIAAESHRVYEEQRRQQAR